MTRFFFLFASLLLTLSAWAKEVTFDFANNEFNLPVTTNTADPVGNITAPIEKDGVIITTDKHNAAISPLMFHSTYNITIALRFYNGSYSEFVHGYLVLA